MVKKTLVAAVLLCLFTSFISVSADFSDVPPEHPYYTAVNTITEIGFMNGYSDTVFAPDDEITRAHLAVMIIRLLQVNPKDNSGNNPYSDVPGGHWAFDNIIKLTDMGIYAPENGAFRPNDICKYIDAIKAGVNALGYTQPAEGYIPFADSLGLTSNLELAEQDALTRAQTAQLSLNMFEAPVAENAWTQNLQIIRDGEAFAVTVDYAPVKLTTDLLTPVRASGESIGVYIDWDSATRTVTFDGWLSIKYDSYYCMANGEKIAMPVKMRIKEGRTVLPIKFFFERYGYDVVLDEANNTIVLTSRGYAISSMTLADMDGNGIDEIPSSGGFFVNIDIEKRKIIRGTG